MSRTIRAITLYNNNLEVSIASTKHENADSCGIQSLFLSTGSSR